MSANNNCIFMGRLTKDVVINGEETKVAKFSLAVDRQFKKDGQPTADFINLVAFGKQSEFCEKYLHKGTKILARTHVQTGSYTNKEGQKVYTTDFVVDELTFAESKATAEQNANADMPEVPADLPTSDGMQSSLGDFMQIPDGIDESLPFN